MTTAATGMFRSLAIFNYRLWAAGAVVSNVGTWMQRTAQDWLVLTVLTHHDATALGVTTALQFAPLVVLLPWTGLAADRLDRRHLLMATQAAMGLLALGLGVLVLTGLARLWEVYGIAALLGSAAAFDVPARQSFVSELVGERELSNAVGLNSTSFNAARMIGPAIAGLMIASIGTGPVFLINAASYVAVLAALGAIRVGELRREPGLSRERPRMLDGARAVRASPELAAIFLMMVAIGTFGLNFAIFISTMSVGVFHFGSGGYGFLTSMLAVGSVAGALLAARRERPSIGLLAASALAFATGCVLAAASPGPRLFGCALVLVGLAAQTFTTSSLSLVQLATPPALRGRVVALLLAIALGGTPVGAPVTGFVADRFGPRWSLALAAAAGLAAAITGGLFRAADARRRAAGITEAGAGVRR